MDYYLEMSYDGSKYSGYGTQPHGNTIQDILEKSLQKINGDTPVKTFGSSRTDAGVHAVSQFVEFSLEHEFDLEELKYKLNKILPSDIIVKEVWEKPQMFNVRYDASSKIYEYIILTERNPFLVNYSFFQSQELDLISMIEAAQLFVGEHDFSGFSSANTEAKSKVRTIHYANFERIELFGADAIRFRIEGTGFLYNMVRMIVGTLIKLGMGKVTAEEIEIALVSKEKNNIVWTAPPQGLYLKKINY